MTLKRTIRLFWNPLIDNVREQSEDTIVSRFQQKLIRNWNFWTRNPTRITHNNKGKWTDYQKQKKSTHTLPPGKWTMDDWKRKTTIGIYLHSQPLQSPCSVTNIDPFTLILHKNWSCFVKRSTPDRFYFKNKKPFLRAISHLKGYF